MSRNVTVLLFLWRTILEINDLVWGQAYGIANVIEADDYGQWLIEKTGIHV